MNSKEEPLKGDNSLEEKVALITGASSGIGFATAKELARNGADVSVAARREEELERLKSEIESKHDVGVLVLPTDVREEDQINSMVEKTVNRFGRLDILVNNAGIALGYPDVETLATEEYRGIMETNVDGVFYSTRAAIPHLKESKGNLIFVSSLAGQYPRAGDPVYAATKWWVRGFALSLEARLGKEGVAVTIVNPAEVRTEFEFLEVKQKDRFNEGYTTEPSEVAEVITFAARQEPPNTLSQIDLYRRSKLSDMID